MLKGQRDEVKNDLFREEFRYNSMVQQEKKLCQEIEELTGQVIELKEENI